MLPHNVLLRLLSSSEGATEVELNDIEAQIGCRLPDDYRCSYRIHNGQKLVIPGSVSVSEPSRCWPPPSLTADCLSACPQADGQHVSVQPLPVGGPAGRGDGSRRFPAEEGDATLPPAHLLLPHWTQPVHGSGTSRGPQDVRELLPLPRS